MKASPREEKALVEALIVESNIRNLPYGDKDSRGALQQRQSTGWKHPMNVRLAVRDFLTAARQKNSGHGSAGVLAQQVQASRYPLRYDQHSAEAESLLSHHNNGGNFSPSVPSHIPFVGGVKETVSDPQAEMRVALAQHLLRTNPNSELLRLGVVNPSEPTTRTITRSPVVSRSSSSAYGQAGVGNQLQGKLSNPGAHLTGVADFEGMKVAAWIKPALEYARHHGWRGSVKSGWRSLADQTRIYNSGVRPAAKPGTSNHEFTSFPGGAVDVSDAETLSRILVKSPYGKQLVWAGAKDPVHFSHPHNGSY